MLIMGTAGAWADTAVMDYAAGEAYGSAIESVSNFYVSNGVYISINGGARSTSSSTSTTVNGISFTGYDQNKTTYYIYMPGSGSISKMVVYFYVSNKEASATLTRKDGTSITPTYTRRSLGSTKETQDSIVVEGSFSQGVVYTLTMGSNEKLYGAKMYYTSTTYFVTYNDNGSTGGSVPTDATSYSSGTTVTVKGNTGSLVKTNYYFNGWNSKADGTGANFTPAGTFSITKDTTLYAKWTAKTKTDLAVSPTSGSVYVDKTKNISSLVSSSSDGAVTYYSSDTDVATVNSSTGVVTGEAAGSATITISQAEDSVHLAGSTTYTVTVNAAPTQYTVTLGVSPAGAGTATAVYGTGGDDYNDKSAGDEFVSGSSVSKDIYLTLTASAGTGYHFDTSLDRPWGGGTSLSTASGSVPVGSDKEYVAHFAPNTYTITLDKNGGSADGSATATYASSTLSVTDATHATKTLTGYYTAASGGTKVINADGTLVASTTYADGSSNWKYDGNVTLYAQWYTPDTYTVTYNANLTGTTGSGRC